MSTKQQHNHSLMQYHKSFQIDSFVQTSEVRKSFFEWHFVYLQSILGFLGFGINKLNHHWSSIFCWSDLYKRVKTNEKSTTTLYQKKHYMKNALDKKAHFACKDSSMIVNLSWIYQNPLSQLTDLRIKSRHQLIQSLNKCYLQKILYQVWSLAGVLLHHNP